MGHGYKLKKYRLNLKPCVLGWSEPIIVFGWKTQTNFPIAIVTMAMSSKVQYGTSNRP